MIFCSNPKTRIKSRKGIFIPHHSPLQLVYIVYMSVTIKIVSPLSSHTAKCDVLQTRNDNQCEHLLRYNIIFIMFPVAITYLLKAMINAFAKRKMSEEKNRRIKSHAKGMKKKRWQLRRHRANYRFIIFSDYPSIGHYPPTTCAAPFRPNESP